MPGTALVMGVRKPAGGAITSRSVCGVNANGGNPGRELLGSVVAGLAVVRSALSKQVASANLALSRSSKRSHRVAAEPDMLPEAKTVRATMVNRNTRERYMQPITTVDRTREGLRFRQRAARVTLRARGFCRPSDSCRIRPGTGR